MERGLLWLPLLGVFIALAWAGWHEFQKVQAYETWAADFDRSKYDIRSVLGQRGDVITWGRPTRRGPTDLARLSLHRVQSIDLVVDGRSIAVDDAIAGGKRVDLVLTADGDASHRIPFTDSDLAQRWQKALHQSLQALKSASA